MSDHAIDEAAVPLWQRGVRLRRDEARACWVVLAPERAFLPDAAATAVLQLVDGARSVAGIIDAIARSYDAPRDVIAADVVRLVRDLVARKVLST